MERKLDAINAFQQGYQTGQESLIKLVNQYCGTNAKSVQQLIQELNQKVNHAS